MDKDDKNWPAWRYGPGGKAAVFENEKDIPAGWQDHPSKVKGAGSAEEAFAKFDRDKNGRPGGRNPPKTAATQGANTTTTADGTPPPAAEFDSDGHPWSADLHAASKSKTKAGLWGMKVGVSRPEPIKAPLDL